METTKLRTYIDVMGKKRILRFVEGSWFVHWHKDHAACWSTKWEDVETGEILQIPNNAWNLLKMNYVDTDK